VVRPTSASTDYPGRPWWTGRPLKRMGVVVLALGLAQAVVFYDHFAVALTFLFGLALGLWLRSWTAAIPAVASFLIGLALAWATGWLHDARPLWEPLLGVMLAGLGGAIGGGIFDLLRRDVEASAPAAGTMGSLERSV
jgi:hypothetical protein